MAGRKPAKPAEVMDAKVDDAAFEQAGQAMNTLALANSMADAEKEEVLSIGLEVGRLEAMTFITTIGETASLAIYEKIKKSKGWKHIKNPNSSDGRNFETLDEFCRAKMGRSYNRLQELAANRNLIGQEAFEQAERLGLRQVDYNAIKALPAPEQELMRRAVEEAKSRDEVIDVLQELAGRFAKTEADLQAKVADLQDEAEAKDKVLAEKSARLDKAQQDLAKAKKRLASATPDEALQQMLAEWAAVAEEAAALLDSSVRSALTQVDAFCAGHGLDMPRDTLAGGMGRILRIHRELVAEFHLPDVVGDGKPAWEKWAEANPVPAESAAE